MKGRSWICLFGLAVWGTFSCRSQQSVSEESVVVKVDTVRLYEGDFRISYPGKVRAAADVNLAFRVAGPIARVPVRVGQYVRTGDLLAEIDPRDYETQLAATEAQYNQVKAEAERVIELQKRGSAPDNDRDKAFYGLQQVSAKYEANKNALADTKLLAPFDGYVQKKFFEVGETVAAGTPVVAIIGAQSLEVEINIPASDYIRRHRFDAYECEADVLPGVIFPLELIGIAQKANLNQLYNVRFRLSSAAADTLSAGMNANVTIYYKPDERNLVAVPLSAVFEKDGGSAVWIYDPVSQTITQRMVEPVELHKDGVMLVSGGITAGEIVVVAGLRSLEEGQRVEPLKPVSKTNIGGLL